MIIMTFYHIASHIMKVYLLFLFGSYPLYVRYMFSYSLDNY